MGNKIVFKEKPQMKETTWFEEKGIFRDQYGNRLVEVEETAGKKKVMSIASEEYKRYLRRQIYINRGVEVEEKIITKKMKTLDAMAEIAPFHELHQRIARFGEALYIDLADEAGHIAEVTADGWQLLLKAPVRFRHKEDAARQVTPVRSSMDTTTSLFDFINIQDPSDQLLFEVTLITCLIPEIAHPVISLIAQEGSAKTTVSRVLKSLIDPAETDLVKFPNSEFDLGLICSKNHLVGFDNMRRIDRRQSDLLCQVVTGGNMVVRKLYTTEEVVTIPLQSCLVINGIDLAGQRPDLLDRTVVFSLPKIDAVHRKTESDFWKEFYVVKSALLGRYLDVLARAMKNYPNMKPANSPRMADYYRWALAVTEALGRDPEEFERAYKKNRDQVIRDSVEQEPLAAAVSALLEEETLWEGTMSELHNALVYHCDSRQLPQAPNQLSRELKLVAGTLGKVGIDVEWDKDRVKNLTTVRLAKAS